MNVNYTLCDSLLLVTETHFRYSTNRLPFIVGNLLILSTEIGRLVE